MIYSYIRISDEKQSFKRQDSTFKQFLKYKKFENEEVITIKETVSGKKNWKNRELGKLINSMKKGDIFVIDEISRIGRKSMQVFEVLQALIEKKIRVFIIENDWEFKDDIQSQTLAFGLSIAAQIEGQLISSRTKTGLQAAREKGTKLGRPKGAKATSSKLDPQIEEIKKLMEANVSITAMSNVFKVSRNTMSKYIKNLKNGNQEKAATASN